MIGANKRIERKAIPWNIDGAVLFGLSKQASSDVVRTYRQYG